MSKISVGKTIAVALTMLTIVVGASAQQKLSPLTLNTVGNMKAKAVTADVTIAAYIHTVDAFDYSALEDLGVKVNTRVGNICTARIPIGVIDQVAQTEGVVYVDAAAKVRPMMDKARAACGVDDIHAGTGLTQAFTGEGVVVGIVDQGFQYDHVNFYDADLSTLRIQRVWEQDWTGGTAPDGYSYGGEMTTADDMTYYLGDVTTSSHGTHVAGIAAGAYKADGSNYYGVAPEADLVFVSYGGDDTDNVNISDAVAYIFDYAQEQGKPCVVNLSLGTQIGPHDGTSSFDIITDQLQGEGRLLVGAAGNFGASECHVAQTFASADDAPLQTLVSYLDDVDSGGEIDVWGEEGMTMTVQVFIYDKYTGTKKDSIEVDASAADGSSTTYTWQSNATGSVTITTEVNPLNNKPHAYITLDITRFKSNSCAGIAVKPGSAGTVNAWADATYVVFTDGDQDGMTAGDTDYTIAEIGGTGNNIITVGAYITRDVLWTETDTDEVTYGETLGSLGSFSSHGPTIDGRLKPLITAPGAAIISSLNNNDENIDDEYVVKTVTQGSSSHYFGLKMGTSMAAPFVTGVLALWLEACPTLTPDEAKDIIQQTAVTNDDTGTIDADGDNGWGYGIIDALEGLKLCLTTVVDRVQQSAPGHTATTAIYTVDGRRTDSMTAPGIYIVRKADGTVRKVVVE